MLTADGARKLVNRSSITNWFGNFFCKKELKAVESEIRKAAKKGLHLCYFRNLSKNIHGKLENAGFTVQYVEPLLQIWEISWIK